MRLAGHAVLEIPALETERLRLRAPVPADLPAWTAWCGSARAEGLGGPFDPVAAARQLHEVAGHWAMHGYGRWIAADRGSDAALGLVGLLTLPGWPEPELAWTVFEGAEGRGIAHEAACAARDYAYEVLGWSGLCSLIHADNGRSQALARRMGAAPERECEILGGIPVTLWRHRTKKELAA